MMGARGPLAVLCAAILGSLLFAALTRTLLDHVPTYDELLHVLPARGVVLTGEPVMGTGEYRRAELYTRAVALAYELRGDNLISARLPSWLSGVALVGLIGAWVTRRRGILAGLFSAAVMAMVPALFGTAVLARFYAPHALACAGALIALYEAFAIGRQPVKRALLLVLALALLGVAWHLQISTVIGIGAAVAGLVAVAICDHWADLRLLLVKHRPRVLAATAAAVLIGGVTLWLLGSYLLQWLGDAPLWTGGRSRPDFYARVLREELPLLAPLLPVAAAIAFFAERRLAVFCLAATLAGFAAHTIAPFKASRYVLYLMPFLAVLWGIALATATAALAQWVRSTTHWRAPIAWVAALVGVGLVFANSAEGVRSTKLMLGKMRVEDVLSYTNEGDWRGAAPLLMPLVAQSRTIVVSSGVKALHAFGDYHYELNASVVPESESGKEFGRDGRTGRQVIGARSSLQKVLDARGPVLVIADQEKVGAAAGLTASVVSLLQSRCSPVAGVERFRLAAWSCN